MPNSDDFLCLCGIGAFCRADYLESAEDAEVVRAAAAQAQAMGISGVPYFIFNQRLAASGAQPPDALLKAMREATQPA